MADHGGDEKEASGGDLEEGRREVMKIQVNAHPTQGGVSANIQPAATPDEVPHAVALALPALGTTGGTTTLFVVSAKGFRYRNPGVMRACIGFSVVSLILSCFFAIAAIHTKNRSPKWVKVYLYLIVIHYVFAIILFLFA